MKNHWNSFSSAFRFQPLLGLPHHGVPASGARVNYMYLIWLTSAATCLAQPLTPIEKYRECGEEVKCPSQLAAHRVAPRLASLGVNSECSTYPHSLWPPLRYHSHSCWPPRASVQCPMRPLQWLSSAGSSFGAAYLELHYWWCTSMFSQAETLRQLILMFSADTIIAYWVWGRPGQPAQMEAAENTWVESRV